MIHRIYESSSKTVREFIKSKYNLDKPIRFWNGDFICSFNQLTSLEGAPKEVGGDFWCFDNQLTSLEGAPKEVGGDFQCFENQLTSLEGAPKEVGGDFQCFDNQLTSLAGAPKEVGGNFHCGGNPGKFTEEEVRAVCNVKGEIIT